MKGFLEDKLGPDDSAMAVLVKEADWAAVHEKMEPYGGEDLLVELTTEDEAASTATPPTSSPPSSPAPAADQH